MNEDDARPGAPASARRPWHEGPDDDAPPESWLGLSDDELLHRIQTMEPEEEADDRLVEIVQSARHFFVRQEAAKRVRDPARLFRFEDDRHIGQVLVRHLTRREDVTYLERLVERSHYVEVRVAAQIQLAQLWARVGGPARGSPADGQALPPPEFRKAAREPRDETTGAREPVAVRADGVDASLLGWALHFVVEAAWVHLGTTATRGLLRRTHAELLPRVEGLAAFCVEDDAHVSVDLGRGPRLPPGAVAGVAAWTVAFLTAGGRVAEDVLDIDVRASTRLMEDALEHAGFYAAFDEAWSAVPGD